MSPRLHLALACLSIAVSGLAQQHLVVPDGYDATEAQGRLLLPGGSSATVCQFVVDARHLQALLGRTLVSIQFRRDGQDRSSFAADDRDVVVTLGSCPLTAATASTRLDANIAQPVEVFRGRVTLPASPQIGTSTTWGNSDSVSIPFSQAYRYDGGPLCIQWSGQPITTTGTWWPIDAALDVHRGTVIHDGRSCSPVAGPTGQTAFVDDGDLVPGDTPTFYDRGSIGSAAWFLLGVPLPTPIDLAILGSPGCELRVAEVASGAMTFQPDPLGPPVRGTARQPIHIPGEPRLLGAGFSVQWAELGPGLVITTSNALHCTVASSMPGSGVARVSALAGSPTGAVSQNGAPVIRFGYH